MAAIERDQDDSRAHRGIHESLKAHRDHLISLPFIYHLLYVESKQSGTLLTCKIDHLGDQVRYRTSPDINGKK